MTNRLAIIGSGDLGQLIAHHARTSKQFEIAGFFDDFSPAGARTAQGPILAKTSEIQQCFDSNRFDVLLVAIGYKHFAARQNFYERHAPNIPFATLVHPSSFVDESSVLGPGCVILPGCTIDKGCRLGPNVLLNTGCTIAHDTNVGAHCFFGPAVKIAGFVNIEERVFLGIGTTVIDNITMAADVQTGGGTVVIHNVTDPALYVGVPARKIERKT